MVIGDRLRVIREHKNLSQGDIEKRTGLLRCYVSRVENGHTVPALETLEKFARALDVRLYQLFYDGEGLGATAGPGGLAAAGEWSGVGKDDRYFRKLRGLLARMNEGERELLMAFVRNVARRHHG